MMCSWKLGEFDHEQPLQAAVEFLMLPSPRSARRLRARRGWPCYGTKRQRVGHREYLDEWNGGIKVRA